MGYYVQVEPGVKVFLEDLNPEGGKTILFLHGWPGSHRLFEYQFNQLPLMGYRCIGVDMRGFGASDKPWKGYNYDRLADDVRCFETPSSFRSNPADMDCSMRNGTNSTGN